MKEHLCWKCALLDADYDRDLCRDFGIDSASPWVCPAQENDYDVYFTGEGEYAITEREYARSSEDNSEIYVYRCKLFTPYKPDYHAYMASEEWKRIKEKRLKKDGYKCVLCGTAKNLNVHHVTYERLGYEDMEDLITVCKRCHEKLHINDLKEDEPHED